MRTVRRYKTIVQLRAVLDGVSVEDGVTVEKLAGGLARRARNDILRLMG